MKLNLGSGSKRIDGYINVDKIPDFNPDILLDLEKFPWPIKSDSAEEILLCHVLEHLGKDTETFLGIIKELYRVAKNGCRIYIFVPHPLHVNFRTDPSHVRSITPDTLLMFSREACDFWSATGAANTPFAHICNVDFELTSYGYKVDVQTTRRLLAKGLLNEEDKVEDYANIYNNLIEQVDIVLTAIKR